MSPFVSLASTFTGNISTTVPQGSGSGGDSTATSGGFVRHTFTTTGDQTFSVSGTITRLEILIIGGGGGGGADNAGGGGAGGVLYYGSETGTSSGTDKTPNGSALELTAGTYTVTVGTKGSGHTGTSDGSSTNGAFATAGGNSRFRNTSGGTTIDYTAYGGGQGTSSDAPAGAARGSGNGTVGSAGGNGGNNENSAGGSDASVGVGTTGQGFSGGQGSGTGGGGGGGGAGGAGQNGSGIYGGRGGYGVTYSISGSSTTYAAGGGGGNENQNFFSSGNNSGRTDGIGGTTCASSTNRGNIDALGKGSGGGGHTHSTSYVKPNGGNGSDGIVIIKYPEV